MLRFYNKFKFKFKKKLQQKYSNTSCCKMHALLTQNYTQYVGRLHRLFNNVIYLTIFQFADAMSWERTE